MITEQLTLYKIPLVLGNIHNIDNSLLVHNALEHKDDRLSTDPTASHFEDTEMPMSSSLETVLDTIKAEIDEISGQELVRQNYWAHIQWYNQSCTLHNHPGSMVSAVYYPQIPKDCNSPIVFQWDTGFGRHDSWWQMPSTGDYFAFPSHLLHYVSRNMSKETPRISISVNFGQDT